MIAVALLGALVACQDGPGNDGRAVPLELDARYGTLVDVPIANHASSLVGSAGKGGVDWIATWQDAGYDDDLRLAEDEFHVYRFDPDDRFDVIEIDPPELISRGFYLWHAYQPDQAVMAQWGDFSVVYVYDGSEWIYVDAPPGLVTVAGDAAYVLVDADRLFASSYGLNAVWDGGSWRAVPAPADSTFGPLERDRFRTVHAGPCTIEWDFATLAAGPELCATTSIDPRVGWSVNGSFDDFFVFNQNDRIRRFNEGAWGEESEPTYTGAAVLTTSPTIVSTLRDDLRLPELRRAATGELLFPASDVTIECECDRATDPTCACGSPSVALSQTLIAVDGQSLDLLLYLDVNGERELYARRFDLPVTAVPFSADDAP